MVNNCGELSVYVSDANGHILTEVKNGVKAKRGGEVCQCVTVRGRGVKWLCVLRMVGRKYAIMKKK